MKLCGVSYPFESHLIGGFLSQLNGYAHWLINIPRQVIKSRWWFEICFMLTHYLGKMNPFGLTIFQVGWKCWFNHQPDVVNPTSLTFHLPPFIINQRVFSRSVVVQSGQAAKMPCEVVWEVPEFSRRRASWGDPWRVQGVRCQMCRFQFDMTWGLVFSQRFDWIC